MNPGLEKFGPRRPEKSGDVTSTLRRFFEKTALDDDLGAGPNAPEA